MVGSMTIQYNVEF